MGARYRDSWMLTVDQDVTAITDAAARKEVFELMMAMVYL